LKQTATERCKTVLGEREREIREMKSEGDIAEEHVVLQDFAHKVGFVISIAAAAAERSPRRRQLRAAAVFRMAASTGEAAG
jgi:hypothetical protein